MDTTNEPVVTDEEKKKRRKSGKREFTGLTFLGCLGWSMYTGDQAFLDTTFAPSLLAVTAAFGIHEYSENIVK